MKTKIISTLILLSVFTLNNGVSAKSFDNPVIKNNIEKKTDKSLKYDLNINYPTLTLTNKSSEVKINNDIKKRMNTIKNNFIKDTSDNLKTNPALSEFDGSLTIDSKVIYQNKDLISIVSDVSLYYAGAAHPNNEIITLNYNINSGNKIKLKDIFKPNSNYLKVLSEYSYKNLSKNITDLEWLKTGTAPTEENFDTFNITKDHLIIYFQHYQVASYAEGTKEVKIPLSSLKSIIK